MFICVVAVFFFLLSFSLSFLVQFNVCSFALYLLCSDFANPFFCTLRSVSVFFLVNIDIVKELMVPKWVISLLDKVLGYTKFNKLVLDFLVHLLNFYNLLGDSSYTHTFSEAAKTITEIGWSIGPLEVNLTQFENFRR